MKSYQYEQLDADTKAYLRFVRDGQGRHSPGVYIPFSSSRPTWAFIVGLIIIPLFLWLAYSSSKAGWAVAMLQTAGVLLGGWLIVYAFRRWMANPDKTAGHFVYFDPEQVYYGLGDEIQIAKVGRDPEVEPRGEDLVRLDTERGAFTVPAKGRVVAQYVADYYEALKWVQSRTDGTWVDLTSAEAGAVAKYLVEEDREPNTVADTGLEVEEIPNESRAVAPASLGLMRYALVLSSAALVFALFAFTNPAIQDDSAFNAAKEAVAAEKARNAPGSSDPPETKGFTGAFALRDYLLNDRYTRHRDEVKKLLSELYTAPIAKVRQSADPKLGEGVVQLLEDLRTAETPAISIRVSVEKPKGDAPAGVDPGTERYKQVRMRYADGFAEAVGKDLVVCGAAPDEKRANIEVAYSRSQVNFNTVWEWRVELRTKFDQDSPVAVASGTVTGGGFNFPPPIQFPNIGGDVMAPDPFSAVTTDDETIYTAIMTKMTGTAPARPKRPIISTSDD